MQPDARVEVTPFNRFSVFLSLSLSLSLYIYIYVYAWGSCWYVHVDRTRHGVYVHPLHCVFTD